MSIKSGHTKRVWLTMLDAGEFLASTQIAHAVDMDFERAVNLLRVMTRYGLIERRELKAGKRRYEYAVTPSCLVPTGLTLEEVRR